MTTEGDHHVSCFYKQSDSWKVLGYIQPPDPQDDDLETPHDMTEFMLKRAKEIVLEDISIQPKTVHLKVLQEVQLKHKVFKGASDQKI